MKYHLLKTKLAALALATLLTVNTGSYVYASGISVSRQDAVYSITEEALDHKMANAPSTPTWHPTQFLELDLDEVAVKNKSNVELKERVSDEKLNHVNSTQNIDTELVVLTMMNTSTSGNIPSGSNTAKANTFSYWQYIDKLVYWGGSASEGIIVPPTPDATDSAHKNGVPILGTVFFPPLVYGGQEKWMDDFLVKDKNGEFLMVDKLIETCEKLGFDGWFINQETETENATLESAEYAELFQEFLKQFREKSDGRYEIMWYDSMTKDGEMDWQNQLNEKNKDFIIDEDGKVLSESMFLNFWWTSDRLASQDLLRKSKEYAEEIGYNPKSLFAGIDVQANGTNTPIKWHLLETGKDTLTSIGLYCPSWTYTSANGDIEDFLQKESELYVNEFGNPAIETRAVANEWRGMSKFVVEKTVVNYMPFETSFSMGNGYNFFIDGEKVSEMDWNNRSIADVMPTYRWIIEQNGNNIEASMDYTDAYYAGNSIKIAGALKADKVSTIKLFSSDLKVDRDTVVTTYAKATENANLDLMIKFTDGQEVIIKANKDLTEDWKELTYSLEKYAGKTIQEISYNLSSDKDTDVAVNIGGISIKNKDMKFDTIDVVSAKVDEVSFEEDGTLAGVNLSWETTEDKDLEAYEIYRENTDGSLSLLGATINETFFINALQRDGISMETDFIIKAVNKDGERGQGASTKINWPEDVSPKADFKASATIVAPNEEITLTNLSNVFSEEFEWTFEGANIKTSTEKSPIISYAKEGQYTIKLVAKNSKGENEKVIEEIITVTNEAVGGLDKLSEGAKVKASSFVNPKEAPEFAVDGNVLTKWCAVVGDNHNITIDLGSSENVSRVDISHAQAGNESPDMNTEEYMIEVSNDGVNFEEVVNVRKNRLGVTSDSFKPVNARYIRLTTLKPTQSSDSAARIYELEVYGLE